MRSSISSRQVRPAIQSLISPMLPSVVSTNVAMDVIDHAFISEPHAGRPADELLPQGAASGGGRIALELKGSLKPDHVKRIAEQFENAEGGMRIFKAYTPPTATPFIPSGPRLSTRTL